MGGWDAGDHGLSERAFAFAFLINFWPDILACMNVFVCICLLLFFILWSIFCYLLLFVAICWYLLLFYGIGASQASSAGQLGGWDAGDHGLSEGYSLSLS